jgi:hypothetical protein
MSDPQPWWAKPGGVSPTSGSAPQQPSTGGGQSYWNPNPSSPPPGQANPYGAPQQPYGAPPQPYGSPPQSYGAPANPWQGYNQPTYPGYPAPAPPAKSSSNRWLLIGGLAVALILVLGGGFAAWKFGFSGDGKVLDVKQAESGVKEILSDPVNGYGANDVESVICNNGENPLVATNNSFTCKVQINGATRQVYVEFTDDSGTYAVDGPR